MVYTILILTFSILISISGQQTPSVTRQCEEGEFRSLVSIELGISNPMHMCAGAIIHISYVLTAANCILRIYSLRESPHLDKPELEDNVLVVAGDLRNDKHPSKSRQSLVAKRFHIHDDFLDDSENLNNSTYENDIALIKLLGAFQVTHYVKIGITRSDSVNPGTAVIVAGWGATSNDGNKSDVCLATETTVLDKDKCNYPVEEHIRDYLLPRVLDKRRICAGDLDGTNDPCRRDSGAPLYAYKDDVIQVVGLVSYHGGRCGLTGYGGVYTDVTRFHAWILKTVRWTSNLARSKLESKSRPQRQHRRQHRSGGKRENDCSRKFFLLQFLLLGFLLLS